MKKLFLSLLIVCSVVLLQAQKLKGDISCLAGQKQLNITYVYDGVTYDGDSEEEFFKDNSDKDDFEIWKKKWVSSFRTDMWEPELEEEFNDEVKSIHVTCGDYPNAAYTLIVKIEDIDPGSFAGPFSQPCKLTGKVFFVKTGSEEPFATLSFTDVAGDFFMTPVVEHRVRAAFDELGETIGEILKKKVK